MDKSEVFWGILSGTFACLLFITIYFLFGFAFIIVTVFLTILVFLGSLERVRRGKAFRAAFLTGLLALAFVTGALPTGLFEFIAVSRDSYIDVSWGAVVLQVGNTGLSHAKIQALTVGNITYTPVDYGGKKYELSLERGQNALLIIHYWSGDLVYKRTPPINITNAVIPKYRWGVLFLSNAYVTPLTYSAGEKYTVIVKTQLKEHHFQIEAKRTAKENLEILETRGRIHGSEEIRIFFQLNSTYTSVDGLVNPVICIYSIRIGNMTMKFHPYICVGTALWEPQWEREYSFFVNSDGEVDCRPAYLWEGIVEVKPKLDLAAFIPYEPYEVIFWTLSNNKYRCTITFLSTP